MQAKIGRSGGIAAGVRATQPATGRSYLQRPDGEDGYSVIDPKDMLAAFQDLGGRLSRPSGKLLQTQWAVLG